MSLASVDEAGGQLRIPRSPMPLPSCLCCRAAHQECGETRPCKRCIRIGRPEECIRTRSCGAAFSDVRGSRAGEAQGQASKGAARCKSTRRCRHGRRCIHGYRTRGARGGSGGHRARPVVGLQRSTHRALRHRPGPRADSSRVQRQPLGALLHASPARGIHGDRLRLILADRG